MSDDVMFLSAAAMRLSNSQCQQSKYQSRYACYEEGDAPSVLLCDDTAREIAGEDSDREAQHKNRYRTRPLLRRGEIPHERILRGGAPPPSPPNPPTKRRQRPANP